MSAGSVYYAIAYNVENFAGDLYFNAALLAVADFGTIIAFVILDKLGRRFSVLSGILLFTVACLLIPFTEPLYGVSIEIVFALIGEFSAAAVINMLYVYTAEVYPTVLRSTGFSLCSGGLSCGHNTGAFPNYVELRDLRFWKIYQHGICVVGIRSVGACLCSGNCWQTSARNGGWFQNFGIWNQMDLVFATGAKIRARITDDKTTASFSSTISNHYY